MRRSTAIRKSVGRPRLDDFPDVLLALVAMVAVGVALSKMMPLFVAGLIGGAFFLVLCGRLLRDK